MTRFVVLLLVGCGSVDAPAGIDASVDARVDASQPDAPPDAPELPRGLVAWYPMDAVTSGVVVDATGRNNGSCTAPACPSLAGAGRIGGAYEFDGSDAIVRVASSAALETTTGFTATAWINWTGTASDGCFINKIFGPANENSWQACIKASGDLFFFSFGADAPHTQLSVKLSAQRWHHVALWWDDATKTKKTYVDGVAVASETGVAIQFDNQPLTIGCDIDNGALMAPYDGLIDDVRIYNRPLSDAEITALQ